MMQKLKSWFNTSILPKYKFLIRAKSIFSYDAKLIEFLVVETIEESPLYRLDKVYQQHAEGSDAYEPYALKRFKPSIATLDLNHKADYSFEDETLHAGVQNEITMFKNLQNPEFIHLIYDIYETETVLLNMEVYREVWIQYEYGYTSLYSVLEKRETKILLEQVAGLCCQLLEALCYLETYDIAHSELTTKNILLFQPGIVKITNFAFAVDIKETSAENLPLQGPLYYSAPERLRKLYLQKTGDSAFLSLEYDTKIDIWSLGIVLLELFLKAPPLFRATCSTQVLRDKYVQFLSDLASPHRNKGSALYHLFYPHYDLVRSQINEEQVSDLEILKSALPLEKSNIDSLIVLMGFKDSERYTKPTKTLIPRFHKLYSISSFFDFVRQCLFLPPELRPACSTLKKHNFMKTSSRELDVFLERFCVQDLQRYWKSREQRKKLFYDFQLNGTIARVNELLS